MEELIDIKMIIDGNEDCGKEIVEMIRKFLPILKSRGYGMDDLVLICMHYASDKNTNFDNYMDAFIGELT